MVSIIAIGDQHFKVSNIPEVELFIKNITELVTKKNPDIIVLLGDLLDTHERLHVIPLNKAYEFIDNMRNISPTYILVGNHDMQNNKEYLSTNHWLNPLKEWEDVTIVDKVVKEEIDGEKFIFCPYVFPGLFKNALNTLENEYWKDASCIFAHQEFYNCKMGAIQSIDGDKWDSEYPFVVSGHIHSKQRPQENIYYPGSSMQVAFGENQDNIIAHFIFENRKYKLEELNLEMPRKKIVYIDINDIDKYEILKTEDKIKLTINGDYEEFKSFKKTKKYKELINNDIKVVFKSKKIETKNKNENLLKVMEENKSELNNFSKIIKYMIKEQNDPYLEDVFKLLEV